MNGFTINCKVLIYMIKYLGRIGSVIMKKKGFTLTELIGTIVILSIIILLGIVSYNQIRENILNSQYNNLIQYLGTKASSYSENTGELNVTVEKLILNGYVEADSNDTIYDPRDKSSINCILFDSKYENGNYVSSVSGKLEMDSDGACADYKIKKEIQICVVNGNDCSVEIKHWYNTNIKLGVLIGGVKASNDARVIWKANGDTKDQLEYETNVSIINQSEYTVDVKLTQVNPDGTTKVFEGTDTVQINIDLQGPKVIKKEVEYNNEWRNVDKAVTIQLSDDGSGLNKIYIGNDSCNKSGLSWIDNSSTQYSVNLDEGIYNVCVMDNAENISSDTLEVKKVDKVNPIIENLKASNDQWQNENVIITAKIKDAKSGILKYSITNGELPNWTIVNGDIKELNITYSAAVNDTYTLIVDDKAGNMVEQGIVIDNIDKEKPVIGEITVSNASGWQNTNKSVTINKSDTGGSGLSHIYVGSKECANVSSSEWVANTAATYTNSYDNGTYNVCLKDNAGNVSDKKTFTVDKIETTKPVVGTITVASANDWSTNIKSVTINKSDTGGSGLSHIYVGSKECANVSSSEWISNTAATYTNSYDNGTYNVCLKDNAGNISDKKSFSVGNVDTDKPVIGAISKTPSGYTNGDVTIKTTITDSGSKLAGYNVTESNTVPTSWISISGSSYSVSKNVSSNKTYYVWAKDNAGNTQGNSVVVDSIDKTKPVVGTITVSNADVWTATNKSVTINKNDSGGSGLSHIYVGSKECANISSSEWIANTVATYTKSYGNGTYNVCLKDNAGNVSDKKSFTVSKIDNTPPTYVSGGSVGEETISAPTYTDQNPPITIYYYVNTSGSTPSISASEWTTSTTFTTSCGNTYHVWAKASDSLGNVTTSPRKLGTYSPLECCSTYLSKSDWNYVGIDMLTYGRVYKRTNSSGNIEYKIDNYTYASSYSVYNPPYQNTSGYADNTRYKNTITNEYEKYCLLIPGYEDGSCDDYGNCYCCSGGTRYEYDPVLGHECNFMFPIEFESYGNPQNCMTIGNKIKIMYDTGNVVPYNTSYYSISEGYTTKVINIWKERYGLSKCVAGYIKNGILVCANCYDDYCSKCDENCSSQTNVSYSNCMRNTCSVCYYGY